MKIDKRFSWNQQRVLIGLACWQLVACALTVGEFYVAKNGNDTAIGSQDAPFATIGKAVSVAQRR